MRKSGIEKFGRIQIHNIILNFPTLDFLIRKIKEREIQNYFCRSLPYFSIYPVSIFFFSEVKRLTGSIIVTSLYFCVAPLQLTKQLKCRSESCLEYILYSCTSRSGRYVVQWKQSSWAIFPPAPYTLTNAKDAPLSNISSFLFTRDTRRAYIYIS